MRRGRRETTFGASNHGAGHIVTGPGNPESTKSIVAWRDGMFSGKSVNYSHNTFCGHSCNILPYIDTVIIRNLWVMSGDSA